MFVKKFSIKSILLGILVLALLLFVFRPTDKNANGYFLHVYDPDHVLTLKIYADSPFGVEWDSGKYNLSGCFEVKDRESARLEVNYRQPGSEMGLRRKIQLDTPIDFFNSKGHFIVSRNSSPSNLDGVTGATYR